MSKEAMKLALEALVKSVDNFPANRKHRHAIWQVREALAEQPAQQEPVAWYDEEYDCAYTAAELDGGNVDGLLPLYTSPPAQRTWVGLTEVEADKIYKDGSTFGEMMRMVEAKLKEKNT